MIKRHQQIIFHALGLKGDGSGKPYRNHFVTGPGTKDYDDCVALVECGAMTMRPGNTATGGDPMFVVTPSGQYQAVALQAYGSEAMGGQT